MGGPVMYWLRYDTENETTHQTWKNFKWADVQQLLTKAFTGHIRGKQDDLPDLVDKVMETIGANNGIVLDIDLADMGSIIWIPATIDYGSWDILPETRVVMVAKKR